MSATIGNVKELAEFLGAETYENNFRPVQLIQYVMVRSAAALLIHYMSLIYNVRQPLVCYFEFTVD